MPTVRSLERLVRRRALGCCEYCGLPEQYSSAPFQMDHIIAEQHSGPTVPSNLALACYACNHHKGPNLGGVDPRTGAKTWLFHPRRHKWSRHFAWDEAVFKGRTPIGRTPPDADPPDADAFLPPVVRDALSAVSVKDDARENR